MEEGNSESQWPYDGKNDNFHEGDESVGNTQKEVDESDDNLSNTQKSASEESGRKQHRLESSPSSVDESVSAAAASRQQSQNLEHRHSESGDIFLDDESDDSSTD
eukprot:CCRYP_018337-RA/>CCRYP_018337-RA protein AED:0.11 eAED:0.11 QI:0/-1/0/1/-1/1/1/0/104